MERYSRQRLMFNQDEMNKIQSSTVGIVGCGGLGGYIIEMLTRIGISNFVIVDNDHSDISNLNRQLLVTEDSINQPKHQLGKNRILSINSDASVSAHDFYVSSVEDKNLFINCDILIDATDQIPSRFILQDIAKSLGIPLIHGAIAGWLGQVSTILPGDMTLDKIYPKDLVKGHEEFIGNPSFSPALVASIQVSECIKVLLNKDNILRHKLLTVDLLENEFHTINL